MNHLKRPRHAFPEVGGHWGLEEVQVASVREEGAMRRGRGMSASSPRGCFLRPMQGQES